MGNALHFLGFGYAARDGTRLDNPRAARQLGAVHDIGCASGAGVLVRLDALGAIGLPNEKLFAYHEDLKLSWRAHLGGWRVVLAPDSRVGHNYEFSRSARKMYLLERNRLLVLAWCYRARTLALLLPALVPMECGLLLFALKSGWWREKVRAYAYLLSLRRLRSVLETRRSVQALRLVSEREVIAAFASEVIFPAVSPWVLRRVANPLFAVYWRLARALIRW